ncbi:hypothetical protein CFIO01_00568 [Colletotrichum fioriniae PJ7]|uniref:Uncharacterized protein n=1 Tax=Colletotrichum fioriniae PJ7 TaxID=1445577 RepID=A0A010RVA4_9PEZI|nr:hypothetical protein CFIO01_00568 [Colletotrichum fioriniae PJ7]
MATREVQALTATIAPVEMPELLESEAAGDAVDVGDATLVRLPEVTGEADAVSAEDAVAVADAEVTSVAAGTSPRSDFVSLFHLTVSVKHARRTFNLYPRPPAILRDRRRDNLPEPVGTRRAEAAIRRRLPVVTAPRHHVPDNRADGRLGT